MRRGIPEDLLEYELSLSSVLEGMIRLPVDVKILNQAPIAFRYEVTRGKSYSAGTRKQDLDSLRTHGMNT